MPLTKKGEKIMASLIEQYGEEKAKRIFYAGKNSGRFTGVDESVSLTELVLFDQDQPRFKKTSDGYLVAQPRVARTGIQLYSPKEVGKQFDRMVKVYRPEDQVFSEATIRSFAHRPVTLNHPPEMVNDANWKKYAVGHTIDPIIRDGEFVRVPIMLMDQSVIKEFESGRNQLSMGYTCDLKWEPGVTADGEEYDAVQCNLRMNHLALVHNARGGEQLRIGDYNENHDPDTGQFTSGEGGGAGGEENTKGKVKSWLARFGNSLGETALFTLQALLDHGLVHCPNCDAMIPDDEEVCPVCGYEMTDGEERDSVLEDDLDQFYAEDYNPNHDPRTGQFASSGGGGGGSTRTRKPSTTAKKQGLEQHGYTIGHAFAKGGGGRYQVTHAESGYKSGLVFHTKAEAVAHAEEHAKRSGLLQEEPPESIAEHAARAAAEIRQAHEAQQARATFQPAQAIRPQPTFGGRTAEAMRRGEVGASIDPITGYPTKPGGPLGHRPEQATAAAVGVPTPGTPGQAVVKRGPGRPRIHPRPGDPGYVAPEPKQRTSAAPGAAATPSGEGGFHAGRTVFPTRAEAQRHIRMQRRRWRWARPKLHAPTYVSRRGFGFTGARIPGLRRQVGAKHYTVHYDNLYDLYDNMELSWTIVFDEVLDALPLTDVELTDVEDFNPNHDPQTGEFTSGSIATANVSLLAHQSRQEAQVSTFSTPDIAKQHAAIQLQTWKKHLASQEDAIKEIKKQIAFWEKAKVRPHVEYETKQRLGGLLGEKRIPVRTHYTVHVDSADLDALDAIQVTEIDLLQVREWDEQQEILNSSDPAMDEIAEQAITPMRS
jgi:hypothetical protein